MTMTTTNETEIVVDPDVPLVRIIREFDAPPAKVFRAHVDPELVVQWQGPRGIESHVDHWDCRTGGSWRLVHRDDNGEYGFHGCFHEVSETRIVQTFTFDGQPEDVALETLWFEDLGDGRTRLHVQSLVDSFEGRDQWLASGMEVGVEDGYAKLDTLVAELG